MKIGDAIFMALHQNDPPKTTTMNHQNLNTTLLNEGISMSFKAAIDGNRGRGQKGRRELKVSPNAK